MPVNKNAMTRYALIDKLLANRYRSYSIQDITDYLAEHLPDFGQEPVSKRCVEKDINYLEFDSPFDVEIEEYWVDAPDKNGRPYRKRCIRYADPTFSIFKSKLTEDEKTVLSTALETLGSFEGLDNFDWLNDLKSRLNLEEHNPIISMSKNMLSNSTMIAHLFTVIRDRVPITLSYHTFTNTQIRKTDICPYLIKEYNNRWFLISGACDTGRILTFAIDRIDDFQPNEQYSYIAPVEDLADRFEEIIGVTYKEDSPLQEIIFWASDKSKDYILTKPLHGSQVHLKGENETKLRTQFDNLSGGSFFKIVCRENYELIRELTSFGPELIVLYPVSILKLIRKQIDEIVNMYRFANGE